MVDTSKTVQKNIFDPLLVIVSAILSLLVTWGYLKFIAGPTVSIVVTPIIIAVLYWLFMNVGNFLHNKAQRYDLCA